MHAGRMPYEDEGSNQGDVSLSQASQRLPRSHQKLAEGCEIDS